MDQYKSIELGKGFGKISFGHSREEIKSILGQPDEIEQFTYGEDDGDITESWHFDEYEFSLSFDEIHDWKLTGIAVSSPNFQINNKVIIGIEREELMKDIENEDFGELELEELPIEEDITHSLISFEKVSLNLWFEDDILTEIQWGPLWGENDEPIWAN